MSKVIKIIFIGLVLFGIIFALSLLTRTAPKLDPSQNRVDLDATQVARVTLTPGVDSAQMATAVYAGKSPIYIWSKRDMASFNSAVKDKYFVEAKTKILLSELSRPGFGGGCVILKTLSITTDEVCEAHLVWAEYNLGFMAEDMVVTAAEDLEKYTETTGFGGTVIRKPILNVNIKITKIGWQGPTIRPNQEFTVKTGENPLTSTQIWFHRQINLGTDPGAFIAEVFGQNANLAKASAFAPLNTADGTRDDKYVKETYIAFVQSLEGGNFYNEFISLTKPIVENSGYGGINLTFSYPEPPSSICDWEMLGSKEGTKVIPPELCTNLMPLDEGADKLKDIIIQTASEKGGFSEGEMIVINEALSR